MGSGVTTSLESQMKSACLASTAGFSPADEINSPTATAAAAWQEIGHNRAFNWVCLLVFRRATKSVKSTAVFNFIFITSSVTQTVSSRDIVFFIVCFCSNRCQSYSCKHVFLHFCVGLMLSAFELQHVSHQKYQSIKTAAVSGELTEKANSWCNILSRDVL